MKNLVVTTATCHLDHLQDVGHFLPIDIQGLSLIELICDKLNDSEHRIQILINVDMV